jgi:hypothetical protein
VLCVWPLWQTERLRGFAKRNLLEIQLGGRLSVQGGRLSSPFNVSLASIVRMGTDRLTRVAVRPLRKALYRPTLDALALVAGGDWS